MQLFEELLDNRHFCLSNDQKLRFFSFTNMVCIGLIIERANTNSDIGDIFRCLSNIIKSRPKLTGLSTSYFRKYSSKTNRILKYDEKIFMRCFFF